MGTRQKIDFQAIKESVSLEQVVQMLNLRLSRSAGQFRGQCPVHGGDQRSLAVTPGQGWFCHQAHKGGDCIALYAHIKECDNYDAAEALMQHFQTGAPERRPAENMAKTTGNSGDLQPLTYLEHEHEVLDLLGITPSVCNALGAGFAPKGTMLNRIAIPLRLESGKLIGYVGIATQPDQQPLLKFPTNLEEMCGSEPADVVEEPAKRSTDDMRKLLRVV